MKSDDGMLSPFGEYWIFHQNSWDILCALCVDGVEGSWACYRTMLWRLITWYVIPWIFFFRKKFMFNDYDTIARTTERERGRKRKIGRETTSKHIQSDGQNKIDGLTDWPTDEEFKVYPGITCASSFKHSYRLHSFLCQLYKRMHPITMFTHRHTHTYSFGSLSMSFSVFVSKFRTIWSIGMPHKSDIWYLCVSNSNRQNSGKKTTNVCLGPLATNPPIAT